MTQPEAQFQWGSIHHERSPPTNHSPFSNRALVFRKNTGHKDCQNSIQRCYGKTQWDNTHAIIQFRIFTLLTWVLRVLSEPFIRRKSHNCFSNVYIRVEMYIYFNQPGLELRCIYTLIHRCVLQAPTLRTDEQCIAK